MRGRARQAQHTEQKTSIPDTGSFEGEVPFTKSKFKAEGLIAWGVLALLFFIVYAKYIHKRAQPVKQVKRGASALRKIGKKLRRRR